MCCKIQILKKHTIYIILILSIIVINLFVEKKANASTYDITNITISEDFDKDFKKEDVFDKAFKLAFDQLIYTLLTSKDQKKLKNINLFTIKRLINSFNIDNEKFVNNKYSANFIVSFNKKNTLNYFENQNIFPSVPKKINLLLIPIVISKDTDDIKYFSNNEIYINWNNKKENHHLINYILPEDEIEDRELISKNYSDIESFDFKDIINKYNLKNYIVLIISENNNTYNALSKIYINDNYEIINLHYDKLNSSNNIDIINNLKTNYEDVWKKHNIINTSIKLPITVTINSKQNAQIDLFENFADNFDLISSYKIIMFNNNFIFYKIVFNGSPKIFFDEAKKQGFLFKKDNQNWALQ